MPTEVGAIWEDDVFEIMDTSKYITAADHLIKVWGLDELFENTDDVRYLNIAMEPMRGLNLSGYDRLDRIEYFVNDMGGTIRVEDGHVLYIDSLTQYSLDPWIREHRQYTKQLSMEEGRIVIPRQQDSGLLIIEYIHGQILSEGIKIEGITGWLMQ